MKNITRHIGKLHMISRMKNSISGNPQYLLSCDNYTFRTKANDMIAYKISKYFDCDVVVTIGTHRNCLTLNTVGFNQNKICDNAYCEAIATHKAPHDEQYCSECIHEHVYDDGDI